MPYYIKSVPSTIQCLSRELLPFDVGREMLHDAKSLKSIYISQGHIQMDSK
jgi:hypothetical protein